MMLFEEFELVNSVHRLKLKNYLLKIFNKNSITPLDMHWKSYF